jgi:Mor family transcriptional regulator
MNRKFYINGVIIKKLMDTKGINALELSKRLNKTRTAIYLILQREQIKEFDAIKIIEALGFSVNEVEEMDNKGLFSKNYIPNNLTHPPENEYFQDFSNKMEAIIDKMNQHYSDELNRLRIELHEKELVIQAKNKIIVAFVDSMAQNGG